VPNAVVREIALVGLAAERVGEAEIRVSHDPPDLPDTPVDQRLGDNVGYRPFVRLLFGKADVDAIVAFLDRERPDTVIVRTGRLARQWIEVPAVPWTPEIACFDRSLAEGTPLMRTVVIEGSILTVVMRYSHGRVATADGLDPALW
jgi:hypothetical protein